MNITKKQSLKRALHKKKTDFPIKAISKQFPS